MCSKVLPREVFSGVQRDLSKLRRILNPYHISTYRSENVKTHKTKHLSLCFHCCWLKLAQCVDLFSTHIERVTALSNGEPSRGYARNRESSYEWNYVTHESSYTKD